MQKPNTYDTATSKPHEDTSSILQLLENLDMDDSTDQNEETQDLVELGDEYSLKKDHQQAKFWWAKAAEKRSTKAYLRLADYYRSVEWDYQQSFQYFKVAAEAGNAQAQCHLGDLCFESSNYKAASEWFEKAAKAGSRYAQQKLGYMYYKGNGVEKNLEIAAEWYYKCTSDIDYNAKRTQGTSYRLSQNGSRSGERVLHKTTKKIVTPIIYIVFYSFSGHSTY